MPASISRGCASARAGVAGNPSDALGGAALAVPVASLTARVQLTDAPRLAVRGEAGPPSWSSVGDLVDSAARVGHDGGDRLVTAAIATLHRHLVDGGTVPDDSPFDAVWRTDIPRSIGLAGSSALVIATLRALCRRWDVRLSVDELAALARRAEVDELGIAAGWMDRAVQARDAPTMVERPTGNRAAHPPMRTLELSAPVELMVAWDAAGASPSGRLHAGLRERLAAGDPVLDVCVDGLVDAARTAAAALERADLDDLAEAVERSCALRERLGALDERTAQLAAMARSAGGSATSAGSGGAILVVPPAGERPRILETLGRGGLATARIDLQPSGQSGSTTSMGTMARRSRLDGPSRTS